MRKDRITGPGPFRAFLPISRILLVLLAVLLTLTGCAQRTPVQEASLEQETGSPERAVQIGLSFDSFVIERWTRDRDVFVSTAQELGAEVNVQNANGDVEEQISQIEYFIEKNVDVIVIIAIDGDALTDVIARAQAEGIRVVCYDRLIRNAGTDLDISFDNEMVGRLMGEALRRALPGGGKLFAIYGSQSDNNVEQVIHGLETSLAGSDLEIIYSAYCRNWLAELAFDAVSEGLTEHPHVDGIMCGNDDLASQAIRALSEHRLAGQVVVVAQDAELSACQRIVEGTQEMTVYKPVETLARKAAQLSVQLGKERNGSAVALASTPASTSASASASASATASQGEKEDEAASTQPESETNVTETSVTETIFDGTQDVPYYRIEPIAVTRENLDQEIIESGFHRREDVYLNVTGQTEP